MNSIRRRLLIWQITSLAITALLASAITYSVAWNAFNRLRDYSLEQIAYSILRHGVAAETDDGEADEDDRGQFVSQIWEPDGKLAFTSIDGEGPPPQKNGAQTIRWKGEEWHTYTLRSGGLTIQVGNPSSHRRALFYHVAPWLLLPFSLLVAVLGGLIWAAVGGAMRPFEHIRQELERRDPNDLSAIELPDQPDEVVPLTQALNDLLRRLDAALAAQRRFVADAAHELRTPLTAIRLQAQLAERSTEPGDRLAALAQLGAGVERAAHLVEQLLGIARLDPNVPHAPFTPVRLDHLAATAVAEFSARADTLGIDLGLAFSEPMELSGHAESLKVMLNNLIDNALRYTPKGGRVDVEVRKQNGRLVLSVADTGPGIPTEERRRVFDRFYRLAGPEIPGSGLGLAIVHQVAELHGGEVGVTNSYRGGAMLWVSLPVAENRLP